MEDSLPPKEKPCCETTGKAEHEEKFELTVNGAKITVYHPDDDRKDIYAICDGEPLTLTKSSSFLGKKKYKVVVKNRRIDICYVGGTIEWSWVSFHRVSSKIKPLDAGWYIYIDDWPVEGTQADPKLRTKKTRKSLFMLAAIYFFFFIWIAVGDNILWSPLLSSALFFLCGCLSNKVPILSSTIGAGVGIYKAIVSVPIAFVQWAAVPKNIGESPLPSVLLYAALFILFASISATLVRSVKIGLKAKYGASVPKRVSALFCLWITILSLLGLAGYWYHFSNL